MNDSESNDSQKSSSGGRKNPFNSRKIGGIAVVVLLAVYGFAQPKLNERFGWNLPGLKQDRGGQVVVDNSPASISKSNTNSPSEVKESSPLARRNSPSESSVSKSSQQQNGQTATPKGQSPKSPGPLASRMSPTKSSPKSTDANSTRGSPETESAGGDLLYGVLRDTGNKRYISPSGLMYTPGSAEGHRLEHLRRHTKDDTSRPIHGVFDGEMEGALKTIDLAYERAKKNLKTTKQSDDGRTIYTVDMGKRIGYVGGQTGQRKRKPMARRVKLVLDGNRVITAFPL